MKIDNLIIVNFRGIARVIAQNLGDTVIIAGQNGSGKSCLFDAIRLIKSTYGGYQQNEWEQFFGEFQIQLHGGARNLKGLFNDSSKSIVIEAHFRLRDDERAYIAANAAELLEDSVWRSILPEAFQYGDWYKALFATQFREKQPEVTARVKAELPGFEAELTRPQIVAQIEVQPTAQINIAPSRLLSVAFSTYRPRHIGVIDYHGAQRHYGREVVQGINLNLDSDKQKSQHSLYNYNNKYNNVKSEMAGNFVRELLAEKALGTKSGFPSITTALQELFEAFFPEKKFLGPRPTAAGGLDFPVRTQNGNEHDLDELSSGEKEILYGYLRIRSSAPKNSIILLDEPELHLNPRLIRGLPEFYRKHLGEALQNQLWLVTHSDALIREAVGKPGFNIFHMLPCGAAGAVETQLKELTVTEDLDRVVADLVGDLAAYRPGGKGLIFEGGGDSEFDKTFVATIFSEEIRGINLIPGTNKARVRLLHEVLQAAYSRGDLPTKYYAIVDKDAEPASETPAVCRFEWDVYHIENYLLEPTILAAVLNAVTMSNKYTPAYMAEGLRKSAQAAVSNVVAHRMRTYVNSKIVKAIDLGFDPKSQEIGAELYAATERTVGKMTKLANEELSESKLKEVESQVRTEVTSSLADGTWLKTLPGREILKRFVADEGLKISYEILRNLTISRMAEEGYKPAGMKQIIDKIRSD
jgi:predicted ATPase